MPGLSLQVSAAQTAIQGGVFDGAERLDS